MERGSVWRTSGGRVICGTGSDELLGLLTRAYAGEATHMDGIAFIMHRNGYPEETYFSFGYTPVRDEAGQVALELGRRLVEGLEVVHLVVPLAVRVLVGGVLLAVDEVERRGPARREVRHVERGHGLDHLRMVGGDVPHDGSAPVVADPHRGVAAERGEQLQHVGDRLLAPVGVLLGVHRRLAVAAHVGRDAPEAEGAECPQLVPPGVAELGPAVHEDEQRTVGGARGEVGGGVALGPDDVRREGHASTLTRGAIPCPRRCGACSRRRS
mgnify:CR=1 FL=1